MSKAVLVLDEMPENCGWCKLCDRLSTCMPMKRTLGMYYDEDIRPDWCPLQEAEPVRHGSYKTIVDNSCWFNECSVCGNRIEFGYMLPPYCPNCGAKMDGGAE